MKRHRNTTQMKEQTRRTEVQINKDKIGKLPEKVFRIMVLKMFKKNLENKMEKMQESINKLPGKEFRIMIVMMIKKNKKKQKKKP